jgi:hypothetical protein
LPTLLEVEQLERAAKKINVINIFFILVKY